MRSILLLALCAIPMLVMSQYINTPNNDFPVYSFNLVQGTDHTTDVHTYYGRNFQTGFYTDETQFWGFDASSTTNTLQLTLADPDAIQSYFATFHDNFGVMLWHLTSFQFGTVGVTYGDSKIAFNPNTSNYQVAIEYRAPVGTTLRIISSAGSAYTTVAPATYGILAIEVDMAGNILNGSWSVISGAPLRLGNVDVDENSNEIYITGDRTGGISQAWIASHATGVNGTINFISDVAGVNSWGRGIDVESSRVFVTGDFQNTIDWGGVLSAATAATMQDVYVLELDLALNPTALTIAEAAIYAEAYDVDAFPNLSASHVYVTGSITEQSSNWTMGFFGPAPPGALHGFIQTFYPNLGTSSNYVQVLATASGEFFKMTDIEQVQNSGTFQGMLDIGGNMNHAGPVYDFYSGGTLSASYALSAPWQDAGFVLRVNDHPEPIWNNLSALYTGFPNIAPTVTSVCGFDDDIFVGGYKNEDVSLNPIGQPGEHIPNLGNPNMNTFMAYIYNTGTQGDFWKTQSESLTGGDTPEGWAVHPNPASDLLYIHADADMNIQQVRLTDMSGRLVREWNRVNVMSGLSVSDVPAGLYLLEVRHDDKSEWTQLVVE